MTMRPSARYLRIGMSGAWLISSLLASTACTKSQAGYCYTFEVVHEACSVAKAVNWGCEAGREYRWTAYCAGWFDVYHPRPGQQCFNEPLQDLGSCSVNKSLPPGGR